MRPTTATMAYGVVVFIATLASWLYGESRGIDTTILWAVVTPVILALFMGDGLSRSAAAAEQAALQTNGSLDGRVKASVAAALADRDAARTRQAVGDITTAGYSPARAAIDPAPAPDDGG